MLNGYILNILDTNIPTNNRHQFRNALEIYHKWDPKGKGFITDGKVARFSITTLYETPTHTNSYYQVAFHKISAIHLFEKNTDDATIGVVSNKFISILCEYKHTWSDTGRT